MTSPFAFSLLATDGRARAGEFRTPHGPVSTPMFMPVGTLASVKSLDPEDLVAAGAQMILANAYHLHLRPGDDLVRSMGGLHEFMQWKGPILTDSGGFQVFSLAALRTIAEDGVEFRSHIDGSIRRFTPESVMAIEQNLGADVIMQFDHVIPGQSDETTARDASERSIRWLARCAAAKAALPPIDGRAPQALFPIVQGGIHDHLRQEAVRAITTSGDWVGYGIGGLSVGEAKPDMYRILEKVDADLPKDRPRYLIGV
jgi:queuine tRNA-ribosyltransferase